jgi:hypothetical protein
MITRRLCRSPHCPNDAEDAEKFCEEHLEIFERVRYDLMSSAQKRRTKSQQAKAPSAPKAPTPSRADYEAAILRAVEDGPLTATALAAAVGATPKTRTYSRARQRLCKGGKLARWAEGGQRNRQIVYGAPSGRLLAA